MTLAVTAGWVSAIISAAAYLVIATTIAAYGDRMAALRFSRPQESGETQEQETVFLASHTLILARALQACALLAGAYSVFSAVEGSLGQVAVDAATLTVSGLVTLASAAALQIAAWLAASAYPVFSRRLLGPVATFLDALSGFSWLRWIGRVSNLSKRKSGVDVPEPSTPAEEVSAAIKENFELLESVGFPIKQDELRMIRGILRMDTVKVREIMRPRVDMVVAPAGTTKAELVELMAASGRSKVPIYEDAIDKIVGIVYARDLLRPGGQGESGASEPVRSLARPPHFVPESQNLERLLREFQDRRTGIAIVVDEYGGISGLVTRTDLVEEIMGKLLDEFDPDVPEVQIVDTGDALVDARLSIAELNRALGTSIEPRGFDTVGGLVYRELGKVPAAGDVALVEGLRIQVESTTGRRIRLVRVRKEERAMVPPGAEAVA